MAYRVIQVQRIKNEFAVRVYETNARVALEAVHFSPPNPNIFNLPFVLQGELADFNQGSSSLRGLYDLGIPGNREEFLAYRILYLLHVRNQSGTLPVRYRSKRSLNLLRRFESSYLEPDPTDQIATRRQARLRCSTRDGQQELPCPLQSVCRHAQHGGVHHQPHCSEGTPAGALCDGESVGACILSPDRAADRHILGSYIKLPLTFVAHELRFPNVAAAHDFLQKHHSAMYVPPVAGATPESTGSVDALSSKEFNCRAARAALEQEFARICRERVVVAGTV